MTRVSAYSSFNTRKTPQNEAILGRESEQIKNAAGGFVFAVGVWKQFERFLILGSEGGSFYVKEQALTRENAINTIAAIEADGKRAVDLIVKVSDGGLAPKNDPALFALALAASAKSPDTRTYALAALPKVARIPTHLFHFVTYVKGFRGMGRGLKRGLANWYQGREVGPLAYTVSKYQQRDGWANRDILNLAHPTTDDPIRNAVYKWIVYGLDGFLEDPKAYEGLPAIIRAFELAKGARNKELVKLIHDHNLSREHLPTESLKNPAVWEALLPKMKPEALIRNLGNMSKVGLLTPLSEASREVVRKITDRETLKEARIHPIKILIALRQYGEGRGLLGDGQWNPVGAVRDALNEAFYLAFDYVESTGQTFLVGVDVSVSMNAVIAKLPMMSARDGAVAMALACLLTEKEAEVVTFDTRVRSVGAISRKMNLKQATDACGKGGATDCSAVMRWAIDNRIKTDNFIILTDNETWAGQAGHPNQIMEEYRQKINPEAKIVNVGMTAVAGSINDPKDLRALDVVGFSADVPAVIGQFVKG